MNKAELAALAAKAKADFSAKGRVTLIEAEGVAYGVNKETDKIKRQAAKQAKWDGVPILVAIDHLGRRWYKNSEGEVIGHD